MSINAEMKVAITKVVGASTVQSTLGVLQWWGRHQNFTGHVKTGLFTRYKHTEDWIGQSEVHRTIKLVKYWNPIVLRISFSCTNNESTLSIYGAFLAILHTKYLQSNTSVEGQSNGSITNCLQCPFLSRSLHPLFVVSSFTLYTNSFTQRQGDQELQKSIRYLLLKEYTGNCK